MFFGFVDLTSGKPQVTIHQPLDVYEQTARAYMREYRHLNGLPPKPRAPSGKPTSEQPYQPKDAPSDPGLEEYEAMTKEELIRELVRSKIRESRLKKGYEVKGDGQEKVFIPLNSKNTK